MFIVVHLDVILMKNYDKSNNKSEGDKVEIRNFGPIKYVDIDIAPLTVFVGPNNSGKSYSALLVHALNDILDNDKLGPNLALNIGQLSYNNLLENISEEEFNPFKTKFEKYLSNQIGNNDYLKIPIEEYRLICKRGIGFTFSQLLKDKLEYLFDSSIDDLIKYGEDSFDISYNGISLSFDKDSSIILNSFPVDLDNSYKKIFEIESDSDYVYVRINRIYASNLFEDIVEDFGFWFNLFYILIAQSIFDSLFDKNFYYMPTSKSDVSKNFSNFISKNLNGNSNDFSNSQKDLAKKILEINKSPKKGDFYDLACDFENELIDGELIINGKGLIDFKEIYYKREDDFLMPLELASSSITELSPLILYFKYVLKKGDTLIIEEPEAHLHPKNQLVLVKYFIKAINEGLNIIMTTHSDYILEKINNFIRLVNLDDESLDDLGYSLENILKCDEINIYHFRQVEPFSFIADKLSINSTGFDDVNFSDVVDDLYDESERIIESYIND